MTLPSRASPENARAERLRLEVGRAAVEIAPGVGGRIAALELDGWDLLRRHGWTDREWGAFVMAPWVGRLRLGRVRWQGQTWSMPITEPPHAIHGTVVDAAWTTTAVTATTARLETGLGADWPFGGRVVHAVELTPDALRLRLEIHADREPMPAIVGWHPWFVRRATRVGAARDGTARDEDAAGSTAEVELDVHPARRAVLDAQGLPTGELDGPAPEPLDDALLNLLAPPAVRWPGGPTLTLHAPEAAAWIVYTAHPDGVCVEPVTGLPDGLNGGPLGAPPVASPGSPLVATFEITWR